MVNFYDEIFVYDNIQCYLLFLEYHAAVLSVSNESNQIIVCKIEATVEDCYHISPSYFFLLSHETVFVRGKIKTFERQHNRTSLIKISDYCFFLVEMEKRDNDDDDSSDHELIVNWLHINEKDLPENAENYVSNFILD